ncbi:hypothetical protein JTE90_012748 [Oedothorax gibbosus]|uniref:D-isomer specific 2-hydroxyacid dehydrogenase NAD-binding domain-containing protein n=1 Tax=Oedothorax gibbosus TaxID=931172 RepID=A0AAV6W0F6_9ARAC|nr:hypothetical protein JTE90_012748 [Oedothorax gibbosus]
MNPEPLPTDHKLTKLSNCVLLPHIGSATVETRTTMAVSTAKNILAGLVGKPLPCPLHISNKVHYSSDLQVDSETSTVTCETVNRKIPDEIVTQQCLLKDMPLMSQRIDESELFHDFESQDSDESDSQDPLDIANNILSSESDINFHKCEICNQQFRRAFESHLKMDKKFEDLTE